MKVFAVIPAFNEEQKIKEVVIKTKKYVNQVIVVDDGSSDKTAQMAKQGGAIVLSHIINMHKGVSMRTGCEAAIKMGAEAIVLLDADGQHNPADIPMLLEKLEKGGLDLVFGSRLLGQQMPLVLKAGNKFLTVTSRVLYGVDIYDTQSGFKAFRAPIYPLVRWRASDYSAETEIIANVSKHKLKYGEIYINTVYYNPYKGTTIIDGIRIFINMVFWRLKKICL